MGSRKSPINGAVLPIGRPFKAGEEAQAKGSKGGRVSGEKRRQKRTIREDFETLLQTVTTNESGQQKTYQENMVLAMMIQALNGNVRAAEYIRDMIGQRPVESVNINTPDADIMLQVKRRMNNEP